MAWTLGSLVGGIFVSLRGEFKNKIFTISVSLICFGVSFAMLGLSTNFLLYLIIMGVAGIFMPVMATAETVLIQEKVETEMMGEFSLLQIVTGSAMPFAILFFTGRHCSDWFDSLRIRALLAFTGIIFQITTKQYV